MTKVSKYKLPEYIQFVSNREYMNDRLCKIFDNQKLVDIINLGYSKRINEIIFEEINQEDSILQLGNVYGNQITELANRLNIKTSYDIIDVSPVQVDMLKTKIAVKFPNVSVIKQDAEEKTDKKYDVIICNKLLHDLPDRKKMRVIEAALFNLSDNGKLIFFEYNKPVIWHPLKFIVKTINRLYKPFLESLWNKEIRDFSVSKTKYNWKKTKYYGDYFQKVVVTRK
jgi:phospholipid N-methyltransferase